MEVIYETTINKIGPLAAEFYGEKTLILFGDNAPDELADYCHLIHVNELLDEPQPNDILAINHMEYTITAVGDAVQKNLSSLGHITLKFNGSKTADLPGTLCMESSDIQKIVAGTTIKIIRK